MRLKRLILLYIRMNLNITLFVTSMLWLKVQKNAEVTSHYT